MVVLCWVLCGIARSLKRISVERFNKIPNRVTEGVDVPAFTANSVDWPAPGESSFIVTEKETDVKVGTKNESKQAEVVFTAYFEGTANAVDSRMTQIGLFHELDRGADVGDDELSAARTAAAARAFPASRRSLSLSLSLSLAV